MRFTGAPARSEVIFIDEHTPTPPVPERPNPFGTINFPEQTDWKPVSPLDDPGKGQFMSWVRLPYSIWLSRIQRFLYDVVEPYLRIFRRILPPLGPLDLSPMVAVIVLFIAGRVVVELLGNLG